MVPFGRVELSWPMIIVINLPASRGVPSRKTCIVIKKKIVG